jgi:hypothetical protein
MEIIRIIEFKVCTWWQWYLVMLMCSGWRLRLFVLSLVVFCLQFVYVFVWTAPNLLCSMFCLKSVFYFSSLFNSLLFISLLMRWDPSQYGGYDLFGSHNMEAAWYMLAFVNKKIIPPSQFIRKLNHNKVKVYFFDFFL